MSQRNPETGMDPDRTSGYDGRDRGESDEVLEGQVVFKGPRKLRDLLNGDG